MGYCYDMRGRLACDACGHVGGVRKRTCPHRVHHADGTSLPYCMPAALCADCYAERKATLHNGCAELAAKRTAEEMAKKVMYENGEFSVKAGYGSWHAKVPAGYVGVTFAHPLHGEQHRLVPEADYDFVSKPYLSNYTNTLSWSPYPEMAK